MCKLQCVVQMRSPIYIFEKSDDTHSECVDYANEMFVEMGKGERV